MGAGDDDGRQVPFRAALFPAVGGNSDVAFGGGSGRGSGVDTGGFPDVKTRAQSADEARVAEGGLSVAAGGRGVRRLRGRGQKWGWGWVSGRACFQSSGTGIGFGREVKALGRLVGLAAASVSGRVSRCGNR